MRSFTHSPLLMTRSERDRCLLLFRVDASREGPLGIPERRRISRSDAEALRRPLVLWHPESAHPGACWEYHVGKKNKFRNKRRVDTKFRVTLRGQVSRPPNTTPSSQESSSSKSVAGALDRLVSRALCDSGSTSIIIISFPPLLSFLSGRYSTALVLGTRVSHRAARAAMKSAS
jgi:hypothetical protein